MEIILQPKTLATWLKSQEVTIIDVRSDLQDPDQGERAYEKAHIPHAHFLHLERDLSGKVERHGGNHPLPDEQTFTEKVRAMGVTMEKPVVIYDAENGMFAARAWWLLAYYGHEKTYVLDGGYKAWVEQGYDVTAENPSIAPSSFQPNINLAMTVTMEEVKVHDPEQSIVIDSRARARYLGETEPLYKKAGHIPGAKNYVWQHVLTDEGVWKSQEQLVEHFGDLPKHKEIIVSCGSGISACPNIIALKQAGFEHVKLYPGSFSDWISYEANPVEKGEQ